MSLGWSPTYANGLLNFALRGGAFTPSGAVWVQLHIGDPGSDGTSNIAANSARRQVTFGAPADGGSLASTVALSWLGVPATETYVRASLWSAEEDGAFIISGEITITSVHEGVDFTLPVGDLVVSLPTAA